MFNFKSIAGLLKSEQPPKVNAALAADFKQMALMRRYVPYLRDFKLNQTSLQAGDSRSAFKGRGIEFEEVRAYNYGDDVRDIDWRVTARKNQPFTKLYNEEKDREVYIWLDLSAKMRFGTKHELKSVTVAKTAALIAWYALENKDRVGMAVFDGNKTLIFEPKRTVDNLFAVFKQIEKIAAESLYQTNESGSAIKSLKLLQQKAKHRAIVFVVGSFTDMEAESSALLSAFARNHELYLINVFDELEDKAPPAGEYLAQYHNQKQLLAVSGKAFAEDYRQYFAEKRQKIKKFCAKINCRYREVRADLPIYKQIKPV